MQMNPSVTIERKRVDCALPKGWQREEVLRKSGIAAGKVDVYYYSPTGKKIETKPQLARHLGDMFDISSFDFQSGKIIHHLPSPSISLYRCNTTATTQILSEETASGSSGGGNALKRKYKTQTANNSTCSISGGNNSGPNNTVNTNTWTTNLRQQLEFSRALRADISLVPPIRQTASIFKQPVTVVRNHDQNKVKHDTKNGTQEKPKQLFWEKRLERLRACHDTGEEFDDITLPKTIRSVGPNVNEQTVLQSLATALHVLNTGVHGQTSTKAELTKNAMAFINPEQPLMHAVIISEDDIRKQEDRVNAARRKLQDALKC